MYQPYPVGEGLPPQRRQPPRSVLTAVRFMYVGAAVSAVGLVAGLTTIGSLKASIRSHNPGYTASQLNTAQSALVAAIVVGGAVAVGLWLWMSWANRSGRNWARNTATVFFAINTVDLIYGIAQPLLALSKALDVLTWLIGLGAVGYLWRRESGLYFKPRGRPRAR